MTQWSWRPHYKGSRSNHHITTQLSSSDEDLMQHTAYNPTWPPPLRLKSSGPTANPLVNILSSSVARRTWRKCWPNSTPLRPENPSTSSPRGHTVLLVLRVCGRHTDTLADHHTKHKVLSIPRHLGFCNDLPLRVLLPSQKILL